MKTFAFSLLITLLLPGCTTNTSAPLEPVQSPLNVGQMHNALLDAYYSKYPNEITFELTISEITERLEHQFSILYPDLLNPNNETHNTDYFQNPKAKSSHFNVLLELSDVGRILVDAGQMDAKILEFLMAMATIKPPYDVMLQNLEDFKETHQHQLNNDVSFRKHLSVIENLAYYSNVYWTSKSQINSRDIDPCEQQGYIADVATGALLFWNPIASIIGSAAASLIATENCQAGNH